MSLSNEWFEYHLTVNGWVKGSEKTDFAFNEVSEPEGTLLTRRYIEYMASAYSTMEKTFEDYHNSKNEQLISELLRKYDHPLKHYKSYIG